MKACCIINLEDNLFFPYSIKYLKGCIQIHRLYNKTKIFIDEITYDVRKEERVIRHQLYLVEQLSDALVGGKSAF